MNLTAENVKETCRSCLWGDDRNPEGALVVKGIVHDFGFDREKLEQRKEEIYDMLKQLPDQFQSDHGGGWSFLNACLNKRGNQWTGLHFEMEQLFCLGIAIGKVRFCLPREDWKFLPGEMPYLVVDNS